MTNSDLARKAHEALDNLLLKLRDEQRLYKLNSPICFLRAAIDALAASGGGHAQNCECHEADDDYCDCFPDQECNDHPYRDPRCSPSPLPPSAREKVRE